MHYLFLIYNWSYRLISSLDKLFCILLFCKIFLITIKCNSMNKKFTIVCIHSMKTYIGIERTSRSSDTMNRIPFYWLITWTWKIYEITSNTIVVRSFHRFCSRFGKFGNNLSWFPLFTVNGENKYPEILKCYTFQWKIGKDNSKKQLFKITFISPKLNKVLRYPYSKVH